MKKRHILATHLASAFGVSDGVIRGLFAINFGKFEEAEDLMLSICDHNPEVLINIYIYIYRCSKL